MRVRNNRSGFSLLEVLVATLIMGIAVTTLLVGLSQSVRNAARLTQHDRAAILARHKMNELLLNPQLPLAGSMEGPFDGLESQGETSGWRAVTRPFEAQPNAGPGSVILQEVALEVWWKPQFGDRRTLRLEAYRPATIPILR